jgi:hypothetical protein
MLVPIQDFESIGKLCCVEHHSKKLAVVKYVQPITRKLLNNAVTAPKGQQLGLIEVKIS